MKRATEDRSQRTTAKRRRHSGRVILAAVVVVVAVLWIIYWYGANQIGAAVLDRFAAAAAARGYTAECADAAGGGFPLSVDLSCSRASIAASAGALSASVDGFSATSPLYRPGRVEWTATGPLVVDVPARSSELTASWRTAATRLDAGLGGLSSIATHLKDITVNLPPASTASRFNGLTVSRADLSLTPGSDSDYRISAAADDLTLKAENEATLPQIRVDAELTAVDFGTSLGFDPRQALRDWLGGSGMMRVEDLTIVAGAVSAKSSGTLTLSQDGKLSGDLDVTIAGIEALPDLVEAFYPQARDQTAQIVAAATAFTRPVNTPSGPARQMTLLVRDGVVSIGILPIGVIPPLAF